MALSLSIKATEDDGEKEMKYPSQPRARDNFFYSLDWFFCHRKKKAFFFLCVSWKKNFNLLSSSSSSLTESFIKVEGFSIRLRVADRKCKDSCQNVSPRDIAWERVHILSTDNTCCSPTHLRDNIG